MPQAYKAIDRDWPRRRGLWVAHYRAKGCSPRKARDCASRKRSKFSTPILKRLTPQRDSHSLITRPRNASPTALFYYSGDEI
jgi:hypothetical protein